MSSSQSRKSLRSRGTEVSSAAGVAAPEAAEKSGGQEGGGIVSAMERGVSTEKKPNWRKDKSSIALLLFLYVLQGIPLGLAGSVPLILQQRKISYKQQATFSLVFWPFSLKLLWAPIVDAVYSSRTGRRKSWLVPVQYLLAVVMLWLSQIVDSLLGGQAEGGTPDVGLLTASFFLLNFFAATQDIAVDGWALTMLSSENVGYASTCNTVGQTAGYFLANVVFLALESADFCNKYLRTVPQPEGIVTLASFLFFWGLVFLITTTLVWMWKRETAAQHDEKDGEGPMSGIFSTYKQLLSILRLRQVQAYLLCTMFCKIAFSAADSVTGLKMIEYGVPKEKMALLGVPVVPLQIILPILISRYTAGPRPLDIWLLAYPVRLVFVLVFAGVVWWTRGMTAQYGSELPLYYFGAIIVVYAVYQIAVYSQFVSIMAWHARISDPKVGGTYMTLLNTVSNLAGNWPGMASLWFLDALSSYRCQSKDPASPLPACVANDKQGCVAAGGDCSVDFEGYYVETIVCLMIGVVWLISLGRKMRNLQEHNVLAWRL